MSRLSMEQVKGEKVGTITAVAMPSEFQFQINMKGHRVVVQDFVVVEHPTLDGVPVLAKIVKISRFNPLLPEESTLELARLAVEEELTPLPTFGKMEMVVAGCQVIGFLDEFRKMRNPGFPVKPGANVYLPKPKYMSTVLSAGNPKDDLLVGHLRNREDVAATINGNEILNKHVAILAMTGAGKTYAASVVIEELMRLGYPLLILDPHSDYINLGKDANGRPFEYKLQDGRTGTYSLKVFDTGIDLRVLSRDEFLDFMAGLCGEEISPAQRQVHKKAYDYAKRSKRTGLSGIYDYLNKESKGGGGAGTIGAVFRQLNVVKSILGDVDSSLQLDEIEKCLVPGSGAVLNMSSLPYPVQRVNARIILQKLFEKRKRSVIGGEDRARLPPLFVVVEEAHNFAPAATEGEFFPSRTVLRRIATEGRKFGFGLCVISQRPSRLDATLLSQCNSQLILKIVNPNDQSYIRQTVESLAVSDLMALPDLAQGEALLSGAMLPIPSLVRIRIRKSKEGIPAADRVQEIADWRPTPKKGRVSEPKPAEAARILRARKPPSKLEQAVLRAAKKTPVDEEKFLRRAAKHLGYKQLRADRRRELKRAARSVVRAGKIIHKDGKYSAANPRR